MAKLTILFDQKDLPFAKTLRQRLRAFTLPPQVAKSTGLGQRPCDTVALQPISDHIQSVRDDVYIVIGSVAFRKNAKAEDNLKSIESGARTIVPVLSPIRRDLSFDIESAFPATFCNYIREKDLLWVDMHPQAEGWHDGLQKLIARCVGLPMGAIRDRVIDQERQTTRRRFAAAVGLAVATIGAVCLYFLAVAAGEDMNKSFETTALVLLVTQRDLGSFAKMPNASSEQATMQLAGNLKTFDDMAKVAKSNGTYGATYEQLRVYARLYLFQAQTQRGDYDEGFKTFRDSLAISQQIDTSQIDDKARFDAENMLIALRGIAAGEYGRTENMLAVRALAKDDLTEAEKYARERPKDVFAAMRLAEMEFAFHVQDPSANRDRASFEQRFASVQQTLGSIPDLPLQRPYVSSTLGGEITGDILSVREFKLAMAANLQTSLLLSALTQPDHAWIDDQRSKAELATEALEREAGSRAKPARASLNAATSSLGAESHDYAAVLASKSQALAEARTRAVADADDVSAQIKLYDRLMEVGIAKMQHHDLTFRNEMIEGIQRVNRVLTLDPRNLRLQAAKAIGEGILADSLAASGDCVDAGSLQKEALAQLSIPADKQKAALKWQRLRESLKKPMVCMSGSWRS